MKSGWLSCRLIERVKDTRCHRCWELGHVKSQCTGRDRQNLCLKCAKDGHKAADCPNNPFCVDKKVTNQIVLKVILMIQKESQQSITMASLKIIQINCNQSYPAHHLALATAKELEAGILVLSEPNKKALLNRSDWICDEDLDSAIKILDRNIPIENQGKGKSFSYVTIPYFTIFGCYAFPNKMIEELSITLEQIGNYITPTGDEAIVVGDFIAKSPQWEMRTTDARGEVVTEWIAEHDLIVKNVGGKPTFQRQDYGSILDLTIATTGISSKIVNWEVSDKESLSDHNYIIFEVR